MFCQTADAMHLKTLWYIKIKLNRKALATLMMMMIKWSSWGVTDNSHWLLMSDYWKRLSVSLTLSYSHWQWVLVSKTKIEANTPVGELGLLSKMCCTACKDEDRNDHDIFWEVDGVAEGDLHNGGCGRIRATRREFSSLPLEGGWWSWCWLNTIKVRDARVYGGIICQSF